MADQVPLSRRQDRLRDRLLGRKIDPKLAGDGASRPLAHDERLLGRYRGERGRSAGNPIRSRVSLREPSQLGRTQRRETFSRSAIPNARAAPVDRSMQRPFTNGPRSLTRTVTLRPLDCEVIVTREPNDLVRWAAVIALGFIRSPDAVRPPP